VYTVAWSERKKLGLLALSLFGYINIGINGVVLISMKAVGMSSLHLFSNREVKFRLRCNLN
jgi:hypothetical protein